MEKDNFVAPTPNKHLKQERLQRGWTQVNVAGFLGTDGFTVNRWERGRAQPGPYFRRKLCEIFEKSAGDLGLLPILQESAVTVLSFSNDSPTFWAVPYPPNPFFTGREEILEALHIHLAAHQVVALTPSYALQGLGGIGKTQLALAYAYQHASEYNAVFWIRSGTSENVLSSVLNIAEILQLPERAEADQQRIVAAVQRWLSTHDRWLLVWDNLEDLDVPQRWLPPGRQGAVLITTRSQALGTLARGIDLKPMGREEGMLFVLRRARMLEPEATGAHLEQIAVSRPGEYAAASELVTALGGLPLALDQAGAYIEETGCNLVDYLHCYEQQCMRLLDRRGITGGEHPHSVTATFVLASERVEREYSVAGDLLRVCAFLHAEAIPEELFGEGAAHLGLKLAPLAVDPAQFDQAIAVLRRFSLVQRQIQTRTFSLHRLVQTVLRERMSTPEQAEWMKRVIAGLNALFPEVTHEVWGQCKRLLPHVLAHVATLSDQTANQEILAEILRKAGDYLRYCAQYEQAEPLYQRALRIRKHMLKPEHPEMAALLNSLALLSYEQGKYEQAEPLFQQTLHIYEQTLGLEHPNVAYMLANLAELYTSQEKYEQAEPLYQQALRMQEKVLGPAHPQVAVSLNGLANLCTQQGKYEQAGPLYERTLRIREHYLNPHHPEIAQTLHDLAIFHQQQGKLGEAVFFAERALKIRTQFLGDAHPKTVATWELHARLLRELEHAEAWVSSGSRYCKSSSY